MLCITTTSYLLHALENVDLLMKSIGPVRQARGAVDSCGDQHDLCPCGGACDGTCKWEPMADGKATSHWRCSHLLLEGLST